MSTDVIRSRAERRWAGAPTVAALGGLLLLGLLLRLWTLDRTISHPEIYVPGIDLPYSFSQPRPRLTLLQTLSGTISADVHPPAYYVLMLGWTKAFGTGIRALRLPSVFFGVAALALVYFLGRLEGDRFVGLLSVLMLALNGQHVFWSQEARMYSMVCFMGLLSTVLLLLTSRAGHRQQLFQYAYGCATLIGLATDIFIWPIFATQILWTLLTQGRNTSLPALLRWQLLVFIIGSPLVAIAAYQSRRHSYADPTAGQLAGFFQLGFVHSPAPGPISTLVQIGLVLMTVWLLGLALLSKRQDTSTVAPETRSQAVAGGPPSKVMALAGAMSCVGIIAFAVFTRAKGRTPFGLLVVCSLIPALLPFVDYGLRRFWRQLSGVVGHVNVTLRPGHSLNVWLAVLPVLAVAGISVFLRIFTERGVLTYVPFLIISLSIGVASLCRRHVVGGVALLLAWLVMSALTVVHYERMQHSPRDYKALAESLMSRVTATDVVFVQRDYKLTPMFYYLSDRRYHFVGDNYSEAVRTHPASRIWRLTPRRPETPQLSREIDAALVGYHIQERIEEGDIRSDLYIRN